MKEILYKFNWHDASGKGEGFDKICLIGIVQPGISFIMC